MFLRKSLNKFERYYKAVTFLETLDNLPLKEDYMSGEKREDIYLKRTRYFFELIGNPDKKLKFIHIAGTSGKGTVTNMVHEILNVAGKKVGSFTSPFVVTSIEKIKIKDKYISPNEFADIVDFIKPFIDKAYLECPYGRPSYFEIFLAIAMIYFQRQRCEWVILEVGLGGRYDATNIIENPIITAITNIDYDHTEILGKTLKKIANDKAGIIKRGSIFFTTEQRPSIIQIFEKICKEKCVTFEKLSKQSNYQEYNKKLATSIAEYLGIETKNIIKGITNARLMCRFEIIQKRPFVIFDGAHNRSKIKTTVDSLKNLDFNKMFLIIGISNNKDHSSILEQIVPMTDHIFFSRFQNKYRKCAHPKDLLIKSQKYLKKNSKTRIFLDSEQALSLALKKAKQNDLILVTGSFFLAGELRKTFFPEEDILQKRRAFN